MLSSRHSIKVSPFYFDTTMMLQWCSDNSFGQLFLIYLLIYIYHVYLLYDIPGIGKIIKSVQRYSRWLILGFFFKFLLSFPAIRWAVVRNNWGSTTHLISIWASNFPKSSKKNAVIHHIESPTEVKENQNSTALYHWWVLTELFGRSIVLPKYRLGYIIQFIGF